MMVKLVFSGILFFCLSVPAQKKLEPVDKASRITFEIKNFGFSVEGSFTGLKGTILFDSTRLNESKMEVSISASTIHTGIESRDRHLRESDYLNVKAYPEIRFVSARIERLKNTPGFVVTGRLTIRDISQDIMIPFRVKPETGGLLFEGNFKIDRTQFGVGGNSLVLSNEVTVLLMVFAKNSE